MARSKSDLLAALKATLKGQASQHSGSDESLPTSPELFCFFSFDLVDSTRYKNRAGNQWLLVTKSFYEVIEDQLRKHLPHIHLWKYVGDELLLYKRLNSLDGLRQILPAAHDVMHKAIKHIHTQFADTKTILSVKATVWCAPVGELRPQELGTAQKQLTDAKLRNISISRPGNEYAIDFLGPDIDAGFRIAKYATRQRVVVSAELAYLLWKDRGNNDSVEHELKIVAFESLKGMWDGRRYPIIWYEKAWDKAVSSFLYDEPFENEITRRLASADKSIRPISYLAKIFGDLDKISYAESLWELLLEVHALPKEEVEPAALNNDGFVVKVDVHCVAICFNQNGDALVAKRASTKRHYPNCWEFGCGQLEANEDFKECLIRNYKNDFNLDIVLPEGHLEPVATYLIDDAAHRRKIPGIIFAASVRDTSKAKLNDENHSELEWFSVAQAEHISPNQAVPNFADTLKRAHLVWQKSASLVTNRARSGRK